MCAPPRETFVLGLRFFVCTACETVFAGAAEPTACSKCDAGRFEELTGALQHEPYFVPE